MIASLVIYSRQLLPKPQDEPQIFSVEPDLTLEWLTRRLRALGLICDGATVAKKTRSLSLVDVTVFAQRYRLRSAVGDCSAASTTVTLQKTVPLIDRMLGKGELDASDAFVRVLQDVLEREAVVLRVEVDWS